MKGVRYSRDRYGVDEGVPSDSRPLRAIEAAEAWLSCPCEEHRLACLDLHDGVVGITNGPWRFLLSLVNMVGRGREAPGDLDCVMQQCARLATPEAVREAIQRSLIAWALG